jgi:hypothetical protein
MNAPNCGTCTHSQAYHDGDGGHVCRAWDPDQPDFFCACKGWTEPAFTATTLICDTTSVAVEPS